jgi:hypothetical protein
MRDEGATPDLEPRCPFLSPRWDPTRHCGIPLIWTHVSTGKGPARRRSGSSYRRHELNSGLMVGRIRGLVGSISWGWMGIGGLEVRVGDGMGYARARQGG